MKKQRTWRGRKGERGFSCGRVWPPGMLAEGQRCPPGRNHTPNEALRACTCFFLVLSSLSYPDGDIFDYTGGVKVNPENRRFFS